MELGFVGIGSMGLPMARCLLKAGHRLRVWNRDPKKAQALAAEGAQVLGKAAEVALKGGVVLSMLSDDAALAAVAEGSGGFLPALGDGLHISLSTVSPAINRRLAKAQAALGGSLVAAPVFGRPDAAAAGKLNIPCSGPEAARARALPILQAFAQRVEAFGEDPGAANVVKLCGNYLIFAATQAMAESLAVAQAQGLDRKAVMGFYSSTNFASPVYQAYGGRLGAEDYSEGGFKLSLAAKDLGLFLAETGAVPAPLGRLLQGRFADAQAQGWGPLDVTALARLLAAERP